MKMALLFKYHRARRRMQYVETDVFIQNRWRQESDEMAPEITETPIFVTSLAVRKNLR